MSRRSARVARNSPRAARKPQSRSPGRAAASLRTPASWSAPRPAILSLPSTDLFSVAICAYLGARYIYSEVWAKEVHFLVVHATAALSAALTAFGGGTAYHACAVVRDYSAPFEARHWRWGVLGWQQSGSVTAAAVGLCIALPWGHAFDSSNIGETAPDLLLGLDCVNWAILVAWSVSTLATVPRQGLITALRLPVTAWVYCAAGGTVRDLVFKRQELPCNVTPPVLLPLLTCFSVYALILLSTSKRGPITAEMQPAVGVPLCAAVFYWAQQLPLPSAWDGAMPDRTAVESPAICCAFLLILYAAVGRLTQTAVK